MARSTDEAVRDTLGNLMVQVIQLQAALEACQERCKQLETEKNAGSAPNPAV